MGDREYFSDLSVNEKALMSVIRAAEGVKRAYSAVFRKYDLSFPQYNVLRVLESSKNGQNIITGVSKIMLVPYANMTGIVKRLEREGFLLRKSDPHDDWPADNEWHQDPDQYVRTMDVVFVIPECVGFHLCGAYLRNLARNYGLRDNFERIDENAISIISKKNH